MAEYEQYGSMSEPRSSKSRSSEGNGNPTLHWWNDRDFDQERAGSEAVQIYLASAKYADKADEYGTESANIPTEREDHAGHGEIIDISSDDESSDGSINGSDDVEKSTANSSQSSFKPYTQENPKHEDKRRASSPGHSPPKKRRIEDEADEYGFESANIPTEREDHAGHGAISTSLPTMSVPRSAESNWVLEGVCGC